MARRSTISAVSVSISGNTVVVGANGPGRQPRRPGCGLRVHGARLRLGGHDPDRQAHRVRWRGGRHFGGSVSISGNTVVVGAPYRHGRRQPMQGAAYVFTEPASGWANMTQTAKLTASDGAAGDRFGCSVSISGNTVVVGALQRYGRRQPSRVRPTCSRSPPPVGRT